MNEQEIELQRRLRKWPKSKSGVLKSLNWEAAKYWHQILLEKKDVLKYLEDRGWEDPLGLARKFNLGFAPGRTDKEEPFVKKVLREGFQGLKGEELNNVLVAAGLAKVRIWRGRVELRDVFFDRLVFPLYSKGRIQDVLNPDKSTIIAFGGRTIPTREEKKKNSGPKYLNSPETVLFKKRKTLYGFSWARRGIRRIGGATMVEGQMDYLRVWSAGVESAVATCGTALTEGHVDLISRARGKKWKEQPVRIFNLADADEAGQKAALRSGLLILEQEGLPMFVPLAGGKDPDEILRVLPADEQRKLAEQWLENPLTFAQFFIEHELGAGASSQEGEVRHLRALVVLLRNLSRLLVNAPESVMLREAEEVEKMLERWGVAFDAGHLRDVLTTGRERDESFASEFEPLGTNGIYLG